MPVAGIYLGTFFVSPRSRKILLGLTAAFGVVALIGIQADLLTGRPMFLHTPYTVLVIAGMLLMMARIAADIRSGFLHLDWSIRCAGAGFGLFIASVLYDFIRFGEGRLGLFIADVSGHGVPAALVSSMLKTALTIYGLTYGSPAELLKELNRVFCGRFEGAFITAACAVLDADSQRLTYSAAGHPPLLLWRASVSEIRQVQQNGLPLGIRESADYKDITLPFARGDRLAMFTDGVVETENVAGKEFGHERLGTILALPEFDADECLRQIINSVQAWRGHKNEQNDDLTLVIAEYENFCND
jgi:hypothetical protein